MTPSAEAANAIVLVWNHEVKGLLINPMATRKYIRKNKNYLPYLLHLNPDLSENESQLLFQMVQIYFIGKNLKSQQRNRVSQRSNGQPVTY